MALRSNCIDSDMTMNDMNATPMKAMDKSKREAHGKVVRLVLASRET
jgi:hypothetical protein